jgi:hypothetical protein
MTYQQPEQLAPRASVGDRVSFTIDVPSRATHVSHDGS